MKSCQQRVGAAAASRQSCSLVSSLWKIPALMLVAWLPICDAEVQSPQVLQASVEAPRESFDGRRLVSGGYLAGIQQQVGGLVRPRTPMVRLGKDFVRDRLCLRGISQDGRYELTTTLRLPSGPRPALVELPPLPINEHGARRYLASLPWNDLGLLVSPGACDADSSSERLLTLVWSDETAASADAPVQIAVNAMGGERVAARLLDDARPSHSLTLDCRPGSEGRALGFNFRCVADGLDFSGSATMVLLVIKHGQVDARIEVGVALP